MELPFRLASTITAMSCWRSCWHGFGLLVNELAPRIAHLSGRRELVRTAGRDPFDQPQREQTEPAKLLAVFVLDTNDKVLTTPVK
ncbi:hypothetical protein ACVJGD_006436 [Bradyrhizobium sp. USDA 10063]